MWMRLCLTTDKETIVVPITRQKLNNLISGASLVDCLSDSSFKKIAFKEGRYSYWNSQRWVSIKISSQT